MPDHMNPATRKFLYAYLNNSSPVGYEVSGQRLWLDFIRPYVDDHFTDVYGSVAAVINPGAKFRVVIEAHADEISWYVNYITDDGYIYVRRNGGSDHQIAPSKRVNIHTADGVVPGVFGWPAIHVREPGREEAPGLKNIFIDVGAGSGKEVESMGIHPGCVITFIDGLTELNGKFFTGRALDNRLGGVMIAEVARRLKASKKRLPFGLYIVNAVQEEVGLRGAEMISRRIRPDVAIVTDVTHDTQSPPYNKRETGNIRCGAGPALCYGPAVHHQLLDLIIAEAEKNQIPFQRRAVSSSTGTDTDSFAYSSTGVASALISLPLKYMHTTVETVHQQDMENVIRLIYEVLLSIRTDMDFRYLK